MGEMIKTKIMVTYGPSISDPRVLKSVLRYTNVVRFNMAHGDETQWLSGVSASKGIAKALGMKVIVYDPYVKSGSVPLVESLGELLTQSDIISIHAMLTKETRGLLGAKQFEMMKKGALLINTARAEIVDEKAFLHALKSGRLGGAAFDVFEKEPIESTDDPMVRYAAGHNNLILTPHIGASTREAAHAAALEIADGIARELKKV